MHVPTATYRLQFSREFDFDAARSAAPYLQSLGVSDLYSSPIYTARAGSEHGYDVVAHEVVNPELGGEGSLQNLANELRTLRMGILLDIVPNHMCIASDDNIRWRDVLENGESAESARFFDVDWRPPKRELSGRVLLPILPDQFGRVVTRGGLAASYGDDGTFSIRFGDRRLPLEPRSWLAILVPSRDALTAAHGETDDSVLELESIMRALEHLPHRSTTDPERLRERWHEIPVIKGRLAALYERSERVRRAVARHLELLAGVKGKPATFEPLVTLLSDQPYRLSSWRVAAHEINYRRFFDVNDLAAIRVEEPSVFDAVHAVPFRLAEAGVVRGLRVDHVDGLYDPRAYLQSVQEGWRKRVPHGGAPYLVVEKILGSHERLPRDWPVVGTTGYEFMNLVTGLLVDTHRVPRLHALNARLVEDASAYEDIVYDCKKLILRTSLMAELTVLARRIDRISEQSMFTRDFTRVSLEEALAEIIACFPVYRTYARADAPSVDAGDRDVIERAVRAARKRNPVTHHSIFDFIRATLLFEDPEDIDETQRRERRDFVMRFQQLTGPVMAKGVEDTAFYRYFPLAALGEVGGNPESKGASLSEFHRQMEERAASSPHALSATDTHDAKRSEDARARLCVLSEVSDAWEHAVLQFREQNRCHRADLGGGLWAPDDTDEYLFYQAVVGVWPVGREVPPADFVPRLAAYMLKAIHEAKRHSSWVNPRPEYDEGVAKFVADCLHPERGAAFLRAMRTWVERIERPGIFNALTQTLVKIAAPGVPDFYQGSECWSFHLVDPDNRRPVDFQARERVRKELVHRFDQNALVVVDDLVRHPDDGRLKMLVTLRALQHRARERELFGRGSYLPLATHGERASQIVAFAREFQDRRAVVIAGRFVTRFGDRASMPLGDVWGDAVVPLPAEWRTDRVRDVFTERVWSVRRKSGGSAIVVADAFAHLPLVMLEVLQ